MSYKIEEMQMDDCGPVAELEARCFSRPWTKAGFEDALRMDGPVFLVAKDSDGMILGYCGMYTSPGEGEITNVAVLEQQRGSGIATALMKQLKKRSLELGVNTIFLEVRVTNEPAIGLYKQEGFTECGIRKGFYSDPKEDALVMKCEL